MSSDKYTIRHKILEEIYPVFQDTINPGEKTLSQFDHISRLFLKNSELEGNIKTNEGYLGDSDSIERIAGLTFENQNDYQSFRDYLHNHIAVSIMPEQQGGLNGLEYNILKLQKEHNAAGPFMVEKTRDGTYKVPPVLFKVPEGLEKDMDNYATMLNNKITSKVPGVDVILSYSQSDDTRYS